MIDIIENLEELKDYSGGEKKQIVIFQLSGEEYAVDITHSRQIIKLSKITPVPNTPDYVRGVINLRGQIIPVIDLKKRFSLPDSGEKEKIITVEVRDILIGLLVDNIKEVLWYNVETELEPAPEVIGGVKQEFVKGIVKRGERLIVLIDLEELLFENSSIV